MNYPFILHKHNNWDYEVDDYPSEQNPHKRKVGKEHLYHLFLNGINNNGTFPPAPLLTFPLGWRENYTYGSEGHDGYS